MLAYAVIITVIDFRTMSCYVITPALVVLLQKQLLDRTIRREIMRSWPEQGKLTNDICDQFQPIVLTLETCTGLDKEAGKSG